MAFDNGCAHRLRSCVWRSPVLAIEFADDYQSFLIGIFNRECNASILSECWMGGFCRLLDVLWIMIASTDDDAVLEPSADKEVAARQKAQIAGAQIWSLACVQEGIKSFAGGLSIAPISGCHAWPGHPDFADLSCGSRRFGAWINNYHR